MHGSIGVGGGIETLIESAGCLDEEKRENNQHIQLLLCPLPPHTRPPQGGTGENIQQSLQPGEWRVVRETVEGEGGE